MINYTCLLQPRHMLKNGSHSDQWAAYNVRSSLPNVAAHSTVNHSITLLLQQQERTHGTSSPTGTSEGDRVPCSPINLDGFNNMGRKRIACHAWTHILACIMNRFSVSSTLILSS